uniref:Uncharacterized protein n=1 Tax=viral metagenome TaxID=1070528 RepID=A0A6C0ESQ3_9ZZZZ
MCIITAVYACVLFFVLTPGVLLTIPPKGKKMVVAVCHAVIFGIVLGITHKPVHKMFKGSH